MIERTLFWFIDGNEQLLRLNERYFALGNLLNRLLNETYDGKKIKFINMYFRTEETYKLHPRSVRHYLHFYGGHLNYDDVFELSIFNKLKKEDQDSMIWKRAFEILQESSISIKNNSLLTASEYAYKKGIDIGLNPDYRMIEADVIIYDEPIRASVWVNFRSDGMYSKLTLEKDGIVFFEKDIDSTKNGIEFFLEMYKSIEVEDDAIVIKGHRDVKYLPLKIPIEKQLIL